MSDNEMNTASSLAIVEKKKARKPGGCIGIFFKLFDWNRKFAKKKLFSKKLLPSARQKQAPGKFGGDEKLPKLLLIANENSGGFPNVKKNGACSDDLNQNLGSQSPGLVARLMGLESMPAVQENELKKASKFGNGSDKESVKFTSFQSGFDEEEMNLEKGSVKQELRPQKLQKTGSFEKQPLSRFGAEAFQFKSVLSRSRKHRPKLAPPVNSPRMTSGRNSSRLIDVAARILEPGLHAKNRAKCALTYTNTLHCTPKDEVLMDGTTAKSPCLSENSNCHVIKDKSLKGQSCKNCGSFVDVVDSSPDLEEKAFGSSVSYYVEPFQGLERSNPRSVISSLEHEKARVTERSWEQFGPFNAQARNNIRTCAETIANRKPLNQEGQIQWHWSGKQCKPQKDVPSSIAFNHKSQRQIHASPGRERVPLRSNLRDLQTNRVSYAPTALNRSPNSRTRSGMPVKVDNCKCDAERKPCNKRDGSLSPVQKRRSANVSQQGESSGFVSSTFAKQRNVRHDAMTGRDMGLDAHSVNRTCRRRIMAQLGDSNSTSVTKDSNVISFPFNSPVKRKTEITIKHNSPQEISISDKSVSRMSSEKSFPWTGEALGALLQQKLKELTCQEEDELGKGVSQTRRTTTIILQEQISALNAKRPVSQVDTAVGSGHCDHLLKPKLTFRAKEKTVGASCGYLREGDHLSPGSVLEAAFSNDSCLSSSVDDTSAPSLHRNSVDCFYHEPQSLEPDAELLDSATSLSKDRDGLQLLIDLLHHISEALQISFADTGLKGSKLAYAEEVLLNAELIFRGSKDFSFSYFLVNELKTLGSVLWADFGYFLTVEDTQDGNQLKEFLFDSVIEYLDSRYGRCCKSGLKAWPLMPSRMTADMLIIEVVDKVRRWARLAGKILDEIIERDMSHSLGKWIDFDIEVYETGVEIVTDLLQILVDEIVTDLCEAKLGCSKIKSSLSL